MPTGFLSGKGSPTFLHWTNLVHVRYVHWVTWSGQKVRVYFEVILSIAIWVQLFSLIHDLSQIWTYFFDKGSIASNTSHCKDLDLYPVLKRKIKRICSTGTREESTNPPFLYNEACSFRDAKSALTFEKCPLVTELKLKISKSHQTPFSISALPLEGTVQMSVHFLYLWSLCQKSTLRFLICCLLLQFLAKK